MKYTVIIQVNYEINEIEADTMEHAIALAYDNLAIYPDEDDKVEVIIEGE
ncbi:MAG: hypothetical protein R3Y18_00085 [Bacillota bacterium]